MNFLNLLTKGTKYVFNKNYRFIINSSLGFYDSMDDKIYLENKFKVLFKRELDLSNPQTFNEKLQWLKLYDRKPEYTTMVDKYEVKKYVANMIGEEYIIPTIGVWDNPDDIDFDLLPEKFVLKCNHNSGLGMCICKDKSKLYIEKVKKELRKGLKQNYFYSSREWPYKNVKPRIIAEQYMEDSATKELRDYKFFCFDGVVRSVFIATERQLENEEVKFDFFDENFNHLPFTNGHPNAKVLPEKPNNFELMKVLASKLSRNIPHLRVDFYEVDGKVYFGELTFFHWSGFTPFVPEEWDYKFGSWISLPNKKIV